MGSEAGPKPPDEGPGARKARPGRARQPLAPPGTTGPGAEPGILIILILILICAVLGLAAGIMVIVSRNTPGGGASGALWPLWAIFLLR